MANVNNSSLSIVSYNMHGFNQGLPAVENMIDVYNPDVFLLQEHWLTPANLIRSLTIICSVVPL